MSNSSDDAPPASPLLQLSLAMMAQMGPTELLFPPAQAILPGVRSFLNMPFAFVLGFRLLRLDLHIPESAAGPAPVVLYASGGAWQVGPKHHGPWKFLLDEGFAVASVEYRLSSEAHFPAALHDIKAAARWLRGNAEAYGLDAGRLGGWGSSAGGYLMTMAGATNGMAEFEGDVGDHPEQSSHLACVIDHYGPTDFLNIPEDTNNVPGVVELRGTPTASETKLLGYIPAERPAEAEKTNPAAYVSADTVPFLIMHGDADTRVGVGQSLRFHRRLEAVGADVKLVILPGANHAGPEFDTEEAHELALTFLQRTLAS